MGLARILVLPLLGFDTGTRESDLVLRVDFS